MWHMSYETWKQLQPSSVFVVEKRLQQFYYLIIKFTITYNTLQKRVRLNQSTFVNPYTTRFNKGIPIYSQERIEERTKKVSNSDGFREDFVTTAEQFTFHRNKLYQSLQLKNLMFNVFVVVEKSRGGKWFGAFKCRIQPIGKMTLHISVYHAGGTNVRFSNVPNVYRLSLIEDRAV